MSANSNLGYTGYLLRKTVQPFSLLKDNSNFNEFRSKNMILYINKKVSNTREREGKFLNTQELQKGINLVVRNTNGTTKNKETNNDDLELEEEKEANLTQLKKEEKKDMKDPIYREIMHQINHDQYSDDFAVVSKENKISRGTGSKKQRDNIEQTLNILVANNIGSEKVNELFRDYKKISLKDKLNELKSKKVDMAKIQRKIKKDQSKMQDLEDSDKVNNFMGKICSNKNISIGTILQIDEEQIQYADQNEENNVAPKAKALEMLEELMEDQEEDNQKDLIKIFKKSQLDSMDTDGARNKFNMTTFKKKNEQTEKLYQQMGKKNKKAILNAIKDPVQDPEKFARKKNNVKAPHEKINVFRRLEFPEEMKSQTSRPKQILLSPSDLQTSSDMRHQNLKNLFFDNYMKKSNSLANFSYNNINNNTKNVSSTTSPFFGSFISPSSPKNSQTFGQSSLSSPKCQDNQNRCFSASSHINSNSIQQSSAKKYMLNNGVKGVISRQNDSRLLSADTKATGSNSLYNPPTDAKSKTVQFSTNFENPQIGKRRSFKSSGNIKPWSEDSDTEMKAETLRKQLSYMKKTQQKGKVKTLQHSLNHLIADKEVKDFVESCTKQKFSELKHSKVINLKIKELENVIDDQIKEVNQIQQGELNLESKIENPNFKEFIQRAEFKRKLISYLVKKVDKKSDVFSKFMSKQFTQNYLQKLSEKDQLGIVITE